MSGNRVKGGFKFYESTHPQELLMWRIACEAYEFIDGTDVGDALDQLRDEG